MLPASHENVTKTFWEEKKSRHMNTFNTSCLMTKTQSTLKLRSKLTLPLTTLVRV